VRCPDPAVEGLTVHRRQNQTIARTWRGQVAHLSAPLLVIGFGAACGPERLPDVIGPMSPLEVEAELDVLANRDLWPEFDLQAVPLAIHDGRWTWLFRHPAPPEGFRPAEFDAGAHIYDGRHPAVTANTVAEIGGVWTAVLMSSAMERSLQSAVGTAVHEAFHAFQRDRHPRWVGDEMEFFRYPLDDAELLALRRLEDEALRRALAAGETAGSQCWTRTALEIRSERTGRMPAGAASYERGNELNEGLARYVERRAVGHDPDWTLIDHPAEAVRLRSYDSGYALARLLDRFAPGWRHVLQSRSDFSLDELLAQSVSDEDRHVGCRFEAGEREALRVAAETEVEAIVREREEARRGFFQREGWQLVVSASQAPLSPRFDPHNLRVLGPHEVLHERILLLDGAAGTVEVTDLPSMSVGFGEHPLADGVREVVVTGLDAAPEIVEEGGRVTVRAPGVTVELTGAVVEVDERVIRIRVGE